jgi:hypothetical protein
MVTQKVDLLCCEILQPTTLQYRVGVGIWLCCPRWYGQKRVTHESCRHTSPFFTSEKCSQERYARSAQLRRAYRICRNVSSAGSSQQNVRMTNPRWPPLLVQLVGAEVIDTGSAAALGRQGNNLEKVTSRAADTIGLDLGRSIIHGLDGTLRYISASDFDWLRLTVVHSPLSGLTLKSRFPNEGCRKRIRGSCAI